MNELRFKEIYRPRSYIHFDQPILSTEHAWSLASNPKRVSAHPFLPFLAFRLTTNKISREDSPEIPRSKRKIIIKPKHREIKISSHRDAAIYTYYGGLLSDAYEKRAAALGIDKVVTAFRSSGDGKCNIHHAKEVFDFIEINKPCVALAFDVTKFFDTLSHRLIKKSWLDLLNLPRLPDDHFKVFSSMTKFSWVSRKSVYEKFNISPHNPKSIVLGNRRTKICNIDEFRSLVREQGLIQHNPRPTSGIPQGSPMSAILSNAYMMDFDKELNSMTESMGGLYRRYCDDIMVVVPEVYQATINTFVHNEIRKLEIECNPTKTEIVNFPFGSTPASGKLQYLGFYFDGNIVQLRQGSLDRYYGKMRRGVSFAVKCQKKALRNSTSHQPLKTRKLFLRYSHLIGSQRGGSNRRPLSKKLKYARTNFISYGLRSAGIFNSPEIRKQIRNHWKKLIKQIRNKQL